MNVNEENIKRDVARILDCVNTLSPLSNEMVGDSYDMRVKYSVGEQLMHIKNAANEILGQIGAAGTIESSKKFVKSSKSAIECFPVSEEEGKDIDELRDAFPNKSDLRAVLEDYFHIYDDWAEITPVEFNIYFKEFIGSAFFEQGKECVIEINKDGKWEMVSFDNTPEGWSTKKAAKIFPDENTARKSALIKRLASAGYSEDEGNLRISEH